MVGDGHAVLCFPTATVSVVNFTTSAGRARGVTRVRVDLDVRDPWQLADLIRDLADIRDAAPLKGSIDG